MTAPASLLKELRQAAGKTQRDVAVDLGCTEKTVQRFESGLQPVTRRWQLAFAAYYGVDPAEFEEAA